MVLRSTGSIEYSASASTAGRNPNAENPRRTTQRQRRQRQQQRIEQREQRQPRHRLHDARKPSSGRAAPGRLRADAAAG